jgi:drug/metabolite transporter (DMT)-like permease
VTLTDPSTRSDRPPLVTLLMLAAATAGWGVGATLTRFAVAELGPFMVAWLRFGLGALLLAALLARRGEIKGWPARRDWPLVILLGGLGVTAFGALFTSGMQWTSSAEGTLIHGLSPLVTLLVAALFLGESIRRAQILGGLVSFGGLAVLLLGGVAAWGEGEHRLLGDVLLLGAALSWSGYSVVVRVAARRLNLSETTAYSVVVGAVLLTPLALVEPARTPLVAVSLRTWIAIGYLAIVSSCWAYLWWNDGIRKIGAGRAAVFTFIVPMVAMLSAIPILDEWPGPVQLAGGALILGGLFIANRR